MGDKSLARRVVSRYLDRPRTTITVRVVGDPNSDAVKSLVKILETLKQMGGWGCSRSIFVDDWGDERMKSIAFWDGDGSAKIETIVIESTVLNEM
jgi:hypothetical protein